MRVRIMAVHPMDWYYIAGVAKVVGAVGELTYIDRHGEPKGFDGQQWHYGHFKPETEWLEFLHPEATWNYSVFYACQFVEVPRAQN